MRGETMPWRERSSINIQEYIMLCQAGGKKNDNTRVLHGDLWTLYIFVKQRCLQVYLKARDHVRVCSRGTFLVLPKSFCQPFPASDLVKWRRRWRRRLLLCFWVFGYLDSWMVRTSVALPRSPAPGRRLRARACGGAGVFRLSYG